MQHNSPQIIRPEKVAGNVSETVPIKTTETMPYKVPNSVTGDELYKRLKRGPKTEHDLMTSANVALNREISVYVNTTKYSYHSSNKYCSMGVGWGGD